jgi:hypothetical protein
MLASFNTLPALYRIGVSVSKSDVNSGARHSPVGSLLQSLCHGFRLSWNRLRFLCTSLCLAAVVPPRRSMATLDEPSMESLGI